MRQFVPNLKSVLNDISGSFSMDLSTDFSFVVLYFIGQNRQAIPIIYTAVKIIKSEFILNFIR